MSRGIIKTIYILIAVAILSSALIPATPTYAPAPPSETVTFPIGTYIIPMDEKQTALTEADTTVFGFIWKVLDEGASVSRIIQPPDDTIYTTIDPGGPDTGATYSGGPIMVSSSDSSAIAVASTSFPNVDYGTLTREFTSDAVYTVNEPTMILIIHGVWAHTEDDLDKMGIPYTMVETSDVEADPSIVFNYDLVIIDCPGWSTPGAAVGGPIPQDVIDNITTFAWGGGEVIFTDIALLDLETIFPSYVNVVVNEQGTWDTNIHNPPITGFPTDFVTQYPSTFPTSVKIFTLTQGHIVDTIVDPSVEVWMDSDTYGAAQEYRILGFYFYYGEGIVEGMAYHPQEQVEVGPPGPGTGDPWSFVAGTIFYGNKFVHGPPPPRVEVSKTLAAPADGDAEIGETATFDIDITNLGDTPLTRVKLTDTYDPAKLDYDSATTTPDVVDEVGGVLTWNDLTNTFGDLAPSDSFPTITVSFTAIEPTVPGVTVDVALVEAVDENGVPTSDDDDAEVTILEAPPPTVDVEKYPSYRVAIIGSIISFDINITNTGPTTLTTVTLIDYYDPIKLSYLSATPEPDIVNTIAGILTWNDLTTTLGTDLAPTETFTIHLSFSALEVTDPVTINTAHVDAWDERGIKSSDEDEATVKIIEQPPVGGVELPVDSTAILVSASVQLLSSYWWIPTSMITLAIAAFYLKRRRT